MICQLVSTADRPTSRCGRVQDKAGRPQMTGWASEVTCEACLLVTARKKIEADWRRTILRQFIADGIPLSKAPWPYPPS